MQIADLKELKALLKLCRQQGVTEISLGDTSFKLGELPREVDSDAPNLAEGVPGRFDNFPQGELSPSQLAFYSAGGSPEDDPENQLTS